MPLDPYDPRILRPAVPIRSRPAPAHRRKSGCGKQAATVLLVLVAASASIFYGTYLIAAAVIA